MAEGEHRGAIRAMAGAIRALAMTDRRAAAGALILALVGAAAEGFGLLLLAPILGVLTSDDRWARGWGTRFGVADPTKLITLLLGGFVLAMIARGLLLYARDITLQTFQARFVDAQRLRVMRALATAPWARVAALDHARITSLVGVDVARVSVMVNQIVQVVVAMIAVAAQLVVIAVLAPAVAPIVIAAAALIVAVALRQARARRRGQDAIAAGQSMMATAAGFLGGLKIAAAQRMRDRFVAEFVVSQDRTRDWALAFQRDQARARLGFALGSAVGLAAVVLVGAVWLGIAPARLIVIVVVLVRMAGPAQAIQQSLQGIAFGTPALDAIADVERRFAADRPLPVETASPPATGAVSVEGLAYRHAGGGGLDAASFAVPAGAIVGIAGPSGGGKTTLIDAIAGLLTPQAGVVTIGGRSLAEGWGGAIAYVAQDGFLFHDTVRRNLDWGDPAIDEAAMRDALALVGASDLVARLPAGLDSVVGERGALLSGGERQRLAIARAVLRRPLLLILDEATSALDEASERAVIDRLAALDPRPTILIVAHRRAALARCERLVMVENGVARMVDADHAIGHAA